MRVPPSRRSRLCPGALLLRVGTAVERAGSGGAGTVRVGRRAEDIGSSSAWPTRVAAALRADGGHRPGLLRVESCDLFEKRGLAAGSLETPRGSVALVALRRPDVDRPLCEPALRAAGTGLALGLAPGGGRHRRGRCRRGPAAALASPARAGPLLERVDRAHASAHGQLPAAGGAFRRALHAAGRRGRARHRGGRSLYSLGARRRTARAGAGHAGVAASLGRHQRGARPGVPGRPGVPPAVARFGPPRRAAPRQPG